MVYLQMLKDLGELTEAIPSGAVCNDGEALRMTRRPLRTARRDE